MTAFAQTLSEKCVQAHKDHNKADFLHLRDRAGVAVLSVSPEGVHCPPNTALELVRRAVAGYVEAGIEEGRRQAAAPGEMWPIKTMFRNDHVSEVTLLVPDNRADMVEERLKRGLSLRVLAEGAPAAPAPVADAALAAAREEGRRVGWAEAFVAVAGEATRLREAATLARDAAERVQEALAASMPKEAP